MSTMLPGPLNEYDTSWSFGMRTVFSAENIGTGVGPKLLLGNRSDGTVSRVWTRATNTCPEAELVF